MKQRLERLALRGVIGGGPFRFAKQPVPFRVRFLSAFLAVLCVLSAPAQASPQQPPARDIPAESATPQLDPVEAAAQALDSEWAEIFYRLPSGRQAEQYHALLPRIQAFRAQYPHRAEPLTLEAITLCTLAAADWGLDSLNRINQARQLLEKSIGMDPKAMEGTALITLGNLFYRLPGWPISFGDDDLALEYLEKAVRLYPDSLDSNYFLGDYWLNEEEFDKAIFYLEKAQKAPLRQYHQLSDRKVKREVEKALQAARNHESGYGDFFSSMLPDLQE